MPQYKPMRKALTKIGARKYIVFLGAYDPSMGIPKPLQVLSNARFAPRLCRMRPELEVTTDRFYTKGPGGDYNGKSNLKATGEYPVAFGQAVIEYYMAALPGILRRLPDPQEADYFSTVTKKGKYEKQQA